MVGLTDAIGVSMSNELLDVIEKSAPIVAEALAGPVGGIAGMLLPIVAKIFGADADDKDDIASKIKSDPDAKQKLKELEIKHQDFILQTKAAALASEYQDTQAARDAEERYQQRTGHINPMLPLLVIALFGGLIAIVYCLLFYSTANAALLTILTVIATKLSSKLDDIYDMYFGGDDDS